MQAEQAIVISTFYKFTPIEDPVRMQLPLKQEMIRRNIKGTLTLAREGFNATVSGPRQALLDWQEALQTRPEFGSFSCKFSAHAAQPFQRSKVKVKRELISIGAHADPSVCVGQYVPPSEWNALISRPEVITIDTRNDYEYRLGHFAGAVNPNTQKFKQMVAWTAENLDPAQHKAVAMYCTGGIRCEKYSSYLLTLGFEGVYHLKGGILQYLEDIPEAESLWRGSCFVFDERVAVTHALQKDESVTMCRACGNPLLPTDIKYKDYFDDQRCVYCNDR